MGVCREVRGQLGYTFRDFVLASVIGNTFDYAVKDHDVTTDFSRFLHEEFRKGLDIDDTDRILERCTGSCTSRTTAARSSSTASSSGFLKAHGSHVTVAVRDAPILNDATMEDALALGFDKVADCLTTTGGGAEIGLDMEKMPADLAKAIDECTIIISKGMANYESLQRVPEPASGCVPDVRQVRDDCRGYRDCTRFEDRHAANVDMPIFSFSARSESKIASAFKPLSLAYRRSTFVRIPDADRLFPLTGALLIRKKPLVFLINPIFSHRILRVHTKNM